VEELRTGYADVSLMSLREFKGQPIAIGALVEAEEDERTLYLFVTSHGGGNTLANGKVQVVTTKSPLGRALLGKREGDDCEIKLTGKTRELSIVRVY
jgi:transcription elongation GreA/GreB family factor